MPEIEESDSYKLKVKRLLQRLYKYGITQEELPTMIDMLVDSIVEDVAKAGRVPRYSYILMINSPEIYEYEYDNYLEISCGFEPKMENIDDIAIDGYMVLPTSGSARMDIESGEIVNVNVSWEERSVDDYDT
ncbi:hypothetical protein A2369_00075 [candidate division WS6 bacterium RIFOXYB1_FULL_33_15]|nr:MAG: hypothetical protein A2369_00075 [candidate division WS6 bacterium RIFOXYB1_FULL_33_15]HBB65022.1 hypothetical protein [Patescibacteria group bacterium]